MFGYLTLSPGVFWSGVVYQWLIGGFVTKNTREKA